MSKKGFSLVELLVVIAVIGILAAISFPIFGNVKNSAMITKSLSNLRQIATAMQVYSSDNNGLYPPGYRPSPETLWYQEIEKYLNFKTYSDNDGGNIFISPFVMEDLSIGGGGYTACTYSVHGVICPDIGISDDRLPVWCYDENPAEIILIGEGFVNNSFGVARAAFQDPVEWNSTYTGNPNLDTNIHTNEGIGTLSYRANDNALVAFLDGHVEAIPRGKVQLRNIAIKRL